MLNIRTGWVFFILALSLVSGQSAAETKDVKWAVESSSTSGGGYPLGSIVTIKVESKEDWFRKQWDADNKIGVYINGIRLEGVFLYAKQNQEKVYAFHLEHESSSSLWPSIRTRQRNDGIFDREVTLGFGSDTTMDAELASGQFKLDFSKRLRIWVWIAVISILLFVFGFFAWKSDILRDGQKPYAGARPPLSLARTQMAIWLFVIVICYIWIWLITGELNTLDGTPLILMGISATTYLGAAMIENTDLAQPEKVAEKKKEINAVTAQMKAAASDPQKIELLRTQKQQMLNELDTLKQESTVEKHPSNGFKQLLSDDTGGVKLHRFQNLVWTVILGLIFLSGAFTKLSMPEFSATLLGVLGISSGTYLGFKFPEIKG